MSNVIFDSETELASTIPAKTPVAGITTWLIRKRIAKDESQANYLLLGILGVCVLITGFALANLFSDGASIDTGERMRLEQSTRPPQ